MAHAVDSIETARSAASSHNWREAYEAYSSVDVRGLPPDDCCGP